MCRILHAHHGDFAGDCLERECGECRAAYLRMIVDEIERDRTDSPKVLETLGKDIVAAAFAIIAVLLGVFVVAAVASLGWNVGSVIA